MPGGTQKVIQDLKDGAYVPPGTSGAVLTVGMQSALRKNQYRY